MKKQFAFVFPGQGSQSVGMLSDLAQHFAVVQETFAEASEVFGRDMWQLAQQGPEADLGKTEITQPIMLIAGVAAWRAWQAAGGAEPVLMAGHSLGEYTAYVCAESLSLADGVRLVKKRGELMRDACPNGAGKMAAIIGLEDDGIIECCAKAAQGEVVEAVNFNAPGQVVIAGHNLAVDRAIELCKEAGAKKAMPLAVSVPCHSELMKAASEELGLALENVAFGDPSIGVVNNVDANVELDVALIKQKLIKQLYSPVRWVESVNYMASKGVTATVECGPGKVLSGMNKRIVRGLELVNLQDFAAFEKAMELTRE